MKYFKLFEKYEDSINEASFNAEGASGTISIKARIDELSDILSARKPKDEEHAAMFTDAMETLGKIVDWNCNKVSFNIQFEQGEMTFDFNKSTIKITRD